MSYHSDYPQEHLKVIYPELTDADLDPFNGTIEFTDFGSGPEISKWEHPALAEPTEKQILDTKAAAETAIAAITANEDAINNGFDTGLGYSLGVLETDQNAFARLVTLLNLGIPDDATIEIADIEKQKHSIIVKDFKTLILQYGLYCQQLWSDNL